MKKRNAILAVCLLAAGLLLSGCEKHSREPVWAANDNSIYVSKAMEVESALVYTSEQFNDLYDEDELAAFAQEEITAYNEANGGEGQSPLPVSLKSCRLEGRTGILVLDYGTPEDFVKFARESGDNTHTVTALAVGKVSEVEDRLSEYAFTTAGGKDASLEDAAREKDAVAVLVTGSAVICTEGKITYIAGEGGILRSENTVETGEGNYCIIFK